MSGLSVTAPSWVGWITLQLGCRVEKDAAMLIDPLTGRELAPPMPR